MIMLPSYIDDFILANLPGTCPEIAKEIEKVFPYRGHDQYHWTHTINKHMNTLRKYGLVKWEGEVRNGAKLWERN